MRTTITIDDELLREVKRLAAGSGKSLTSVIEDALRAALSRQRRPERSERVSLPTFDGHGLQPGVDVDDSAALLDLMESDDSR